MSDFDLKTTLGPQYAPPGPPFCTLWARISTPNQQISHPNNITNILNGNSHCTQTFSIHIWNLHVACIMRSHSSNSHLKLRIPIHSTFKFPTPGLAGSRKRLQLWSKTFWNNPSLPPRKATVLDPPRNTNGKTRTGQAWRMKGRKWRAARLHARAQEREQSSWISSCP